CGITTPLRYASEFAFTGRKDELVLEICRELGATTYLSGTLGRDYLSREQFRDAGIGLAFQEYPCQPYAQPHPPFSGGLSALDMLFNLGGEATRRCVLDGNASRDEIVGLHDAV